MKKNTSFHNIVNYLEEVIIKRKSSKKITYTKTLLAKDIAKISQKFGEEAVELVIASNYKNKDDIIHESADLLYHLFVLWNKAGISLEDLAKELDSRKNDR